MKIPYMVKILSYFMNTPAGKNRNIANIESRICNTKLIIILINILEKWKAMFLLNNFPAIFPNVVWCSGIKCRLFQKGLQKNTVSERVTEQYCFRKGYRTILFQKGLHNNTVSERVTEQYYWSSFGSYIIYL